MIFIEKTLENMVEQLSQFFGVAAETIRQNLPTWLEMYGKYVYAKNVPEFLLITFMFLVFFLVIEGCWRAETDIYTLKSKIIAKLLIAVLVIVIFVCLSMSFIVNPQLYGLEGLLKQIRMLG